MNKYYENAEGQLFVDPILSNHDGLTEITQEQFNQIIEERSKPTTNQLLRQLTQARKFQERQGVTINGIRYAGDPGNRQSLKEAIEFMNEAGLTEFPKWKCSDDEFRVNHPLADVADAYRAIGMRRVALIAAEGEYAAQIIAGTLTDLTETEVVWP
jgi:cell division ATPase FtsA